MAYPYFPATYQPVFNPYQNQMQNTVPQTPSRQIQNGEFVLTQSEDEARNYPVAPGNSVTFKNVNAPFFYTKTMGFSQFDKPVFERFRIVKEDDISPENAHKTDDKTQGMDVPDYATKRDFDTLKQDFDAIKADFVQLKSEIAPKNVKGKAKNDE